MSATIAPTTNDRLLQAIRSIITAEFPQNSYFGIYEYTVTNTDGVTLDCQITDTSMPLPPTLNRVPIGSLAEGGNGTPMMSTRVLIEFVNGDPTRPVALNLDPMNEVVTLDATQIVNLGPTAANPVMIGPGPYQNAARVGDSGQIFFPVGYVTGVAVLSATPFTLTLTNVPCYIVTPAPCVIVSGNDLILQ